MTKFEAIATELKSTQVQDLVSTQPSIERSAQVGFNPEQLLPAQTYIEAGVEKITALANAVGLQDKIPQIIEIFRAMTSSWGERKVGETSAWLSDVSDDSAPFEFSIALDPQQAELRVLIEAQGSDPNLQSNWQAGLALNQHLAEHFNISLDRFQQIEDLFVPTNPEAKFSMWHAACFYPDKEPAFKLYLNPQAQEKSRAAAVVEESLVRLGFPHAWMGLAEIAAQRGPDKDDFVYFSIDLANHNRSRVKVYLRHYDATVEDLEQALSLAANYIAGDATEFCQTMAEGQSSFFAKPVTTCFAWVEGTDAIPSSGTLQLPISNYATDDQVVCDRLDLYFIQQGLPVSIYHSAIKALTKRSLESGIGMHSYISLRRDRQQQRIAIYLNPEVNTIKPPSKVTTVQPKHSLHSIEAAVKNLQIDSMGDYPFFQRLHREPVNLTHLWLLFANGQEGVVNHFTRRLALVVAHIDSEHIRCILAKQLNEELGNGDISQVHRKIFEGLILSLESYKPQSITEEMLAPGRKLSQRLELLYSDPNPYIGLGAAILMEIRGKQRDEIVDKELVRTNVPRSSLSSFYLHKEIEMVHTEEVIDLACLIDNSDGDKSAVLQGLEMTSNALWDFCNGMYRACFM